MIKKLIILAIFAVVAIVAYNYYYGTDSEQASAENIVKQTKTLGKSVSSLLSDQKEAYDAGKYDEIVDNVRGVYDQVADYMSTLDEEEIKQRYANLLKQFGNFKEFIEARKLNPDELSEEDYDQLTRIWEMLEEESAILSDQVEQNEKEKAEK
jgi:hypothetical protein